MNKRKVLLACLGMLSVIGSSAVMAGNRAGAVTLSLNGSYYDFSDKRHMNNNFVPNFGLAYDFTDQWAIEANAGLINTQVNPPKVNATTGEHGMLYTVDGLYRFWRTGCIEPFVSAGVGVLTLVPNGVDSEHQGNINAGLGTQIFATDSIGFRFEARDIYTMSGGKNDVQLNAGLSFLFGGETPKSMVMPQTYKG